MRRFPKELRDLLDPAVAAARAALADMDPDDVPPALRRAAAYTGGRLPPPLAVSLLTELDGDPGLRGKAAEKLGAGKDGDPAAAFLTREEGWWVVVAAALADAGTAAAGRRVDVAEAKIAGLTERLDIAKRRLKQAKAETASARTKARRQARSREAPRGTTDGLQEAKARIRDLEEALREALADRAEAEALAARLRSRVRARARRKAAAAPSGPGTALGGDAIETARMLDLMAAAAPHRPVAAAGAGAVSQARRLELPGGIRPDAREALDWLTSVPEPVTLIVDGYNVLYTVDPSGFTTGRSRDMLAHQLARLRRAAGTMRVIVVYDSGLPGDREPRPLPGGVQLRFAREDQLADDAIVDLADAAKGAVVVVSSDRELRERVEEVGAMALWSEALAGWIGSREA